MRSALLLTVLLLALPAKADALTDFTVHVDSSGKSYTSAKNAESGLDVDLDSATSVTGLWDNQTGSNMTDGASVTWNAAANSGTLIHMTTTSIGPSNSYFIIEDSAGTLEDNDTVTDGTNTFDIAGSPDQLDDVEIILFSFIDTSTFSVGGADTDSSHTMNFVVDSTARHAGIRDNTKYQIDPADYSADLINVDGGIDVIFDGLQLIQGEENSGIECVDGLFMNANANYVFKNMYLEKVSGTGSGRDGFNLDANGANVQAVIVNTIINDFSGSGDTAINLGTGNTPAWYVYHTTAVDGNIGFNVASTEATLKNNIANGNTTDYSGTPTSNGKNISEDTTSPDTSYRSIAVTFDNEAGEDFTVDDSSHDSTLDDGEDLSGDAVHAVSDDIEYASRGSAPYIGASEGPAAAGGAEPPKRRVIMVN